MWFCQRNSRIVHLLSDGRLNKSINHSTDIAQDCHGWYGFFGFTILDSAPVSCGEVDPQG